MAILQHAFAHVHSSSDDRQPLAPDLADDFSQAKNIAKENPQKLRELQSRFLIEAVKYNVLPLDSSFADRMDPCNSSKSSARSNGFHILPWHDPSPRG